MHDFSLIRTRRALRVALLVAAFGQSAWAATTVPTQIGGTQTAPVATTVATTEAARQQAADLEQARTWGVTTDEIQRARVLMQPGSARAAFSAPNISPVEVLGIHARTAAERQKYAELFAKALHADTERIVKRAEALFRLMPPEVPEFDHFAPARWLLENPHVLDGDSPAVLATLERAEQVFLRFNALLDKSGSNV